MIDFLVSIPLPQLVARTLLTCMADSNGGNFCKLRLRLSANHILSNEQLGAEQRVMNFWSPVRPTFRE
jgi:hypothetical protein